MFWKKKSYRCFSKLFCIHWKPSRVRLTDCVFYCSLNRCVQRKMVLWKTQMYFNAQFVIAGKRTPITSPELCTPWLVSKEGAHRSGREASTCLLPQTVAICKMLLKNFCMMKKRPKVFYPSNCHIFKHEKIESSWSGHNAAWRRDMARSVRLCKSILGKKKMSGLCRMCL